MRLGWSRFGKARLGALAYTGAARAMVFTSAGSSLVTIVDTNTKTALHTALSLTWSPPFTELAADVAAGATQITVTTDAGFERGAPFEIVMGTEVRMVTSKASALVWNAAAASRNTTSEPHFAGGRVYMLPHTIEVNKGAFVKDYTAIAMRTLKTHEMSDGGEIECSWEFETSDPTTWLPPTDAHVRIKDLDGSYFGGLTARPEIVRRSDGGCHITVTARGYIQAAGADGYDDSRIWDAFTAGHQIITDARDEKCQGLISGSNAFVIDGGQSISQPLDGIDQSPRQLWNTICDQGDVGDPLDLQVRTDNSGSPNLHLRRRPAAKLIKIPWATVTDVGLAWDVALQHTKVVVRWRDGRVVVQSGGGVTRTLRKDFSSSIDNVDLAYQVANQLLAETSVLNAIGNKPIVLEYPKPVYDTDGVTEIPHHRIRAGWRAELTGITAWRGDLPIPQFLIVDKGTDESRYKVTLQLGSLVRDDMDIAAQYTGRQTKRLGSTVSGLIPQFVTPPPGVPTGVASELTSWGASGVDGTKRLGWESIAKDAAISPIWVQIDGGGVVIALDRPRIEVNIDVEMWLCGLRLMANDGVGDPPGPAAISVNIKKGDLTTYPAATTLVGAISVNGDPETIDFPDDVTLTGVNTMVLLEPGMFLTVTMVAPAPTALMASLALMVRRTEDSSRGGAPSTPTVTATSSTDAQGLVTFTVTTNMICTAQIEYGPDTNYRSKTLVSPQPKRVQTIVQAGIPAGFHYKVHVWNADGVHNVTADQVI